MALQSSLNKGNWFSDTPGRVGFLVSALLLAGLWIGPLPELSRHSFTAHMSLHLGVAVGVGPILGITLVRAGYGLGGHRRLLVWAVAASLVEMLVVWGWHAPAAHQAAMTHWGLFSLQQLTFLAAGTFIWLASFSSHSPAGAGVGALAMLMTFMHMTMLGVLLALVPDLLYAPDFYQGSTASAQLQDQNLGGILMALGGSIPYLIGGMVLAYRLLASTDH